MLLYLLLLTLVGRKDQKEVTIKQEPEKVIAKEVEVEEKVEWVAGDRVTTKEDGSVEVVPAENFMDSPVQAIKKFTETYSGSRIDKEYFAYLDEHCSDEALRTVVAISVAETSMGRNTKNKANFFGWFKGGNRYYDTDKETMAKEICTGITKYYIGIGEDMAKATRYVGHNPSTWLRNYRWAYSQMEVK